MTNGEFPKVIGGLETRLDVFPGIAHWVNTKLPMAASPTTIISTGIDFLPWLCLQS